jgi:P4 family phage/plasmid primase-like protien
VARVDEHPTTDPAAILELLKDNHTSDASEMIVNNILAKEYILTSRDDDKPEMWIYKEGIYIPQGKTYIEEYCRRILSNKYKESIANLVVAKIQTDTYISHEELFREEEPNFVVLKNGLLDTTTKLLSPYTPAKRFFTKLPLTYDPTKECPAIKQFFKEVLASEEDAQVVQELFGFILWREYFIEKSFFFNGKGRNGKSKTLEILKQFIGKENCAEIPLTDISGGDPFAVSALFKKMANISGEINESALKSTGMFKSLTGRDTIEANRKFKERVQFQNYAKLIFSANEIPITKDMSHAFFNRWIILDFPYTFHTKTEYAKLKGVSKYNKIANPNITREIITPGEMSGLLNWALVGLDRLRDNGEFSYGTSTEDVKTIWVRRSNSIASFIQDCVEICDGVCTPKVALKDAYGKYCLKLDLPIQGDREIKAQMEAVGAVGDDREVIEGKYVHVWGNARLKGEYAKKEIQEEIIRTPTTQDRILICLGVNEDPIDTAGISKILSIPEEEVQVCLDKLKANQDVYEPRSGYYKILE